MPPLSLLTQSRLDFYDLLTITPRHILSRYSPSLPPAIESALTSWLAQWQDRDKSHPPDQEAYHPIHLACCHGYA